MNFLLAAAEVGKNDMATSIINQYGFMPTLMFGLKIVLIGMIAVFAVLCLIWLAIALFSKLFTKASVAPKDEAKVQAPATPVAPVSNDAQIVAAIAAAIAMAEAESSGAKFRVVSFKRK